MFTVVPELSDVLNKIISFYNTKNRYAHFSVFMKLEADYTTRYNYNFYVNF